ncbi:hypothetical protein Nepgr_012420 [Nepenthes gracilis]|uniref:Protein Iojap, chloroplastic n=1 Tax=Nepenthes gracilis TaxID=150966 RepID=A0AAD3SH92_NEPGR|nr:hypothetical protein Nepgr_012420 [Nepenthes gracilis]
MSSSSGLLFLSKPCCTSFIETHLGNWLDGFPIRRIRRRRRPFRSWTCQSPQSETVELGKSKHLEFPIIAPRSRELSSVCSCRAIGSNVNEDADDMFDDLFNKHGKVVFRRNDQKSPVAEVDDDAESLSFAVAMAKIASEVKAADIRVLFVKPLVYWTRFFIVITAFSRPQIDAIKTKMGHLAEKKFGRTASGDSKPNSWTLLDYGDVVVHIFLPQQRTFYNLEEFYGNATPIELPFEDQQPFRY